MPCSGFTAFYTANSKVKMEKKIQKLTPEVFYEKGVLIAKKETLTQMFSCEFYEIFQSTFFSEHLWELLNWIFLS